MEYRFDAGQLQFGGEKDARVLQSYAARLNKNDYLEEGEDDRWRPSGDSLQTVIYKCRRISCIHSIMTRTYDRPSPTTVLRPIKR